MRGAGVYDKVGGVTALRLADPSGTRHSLLRDLIVGNKSVHFDWQEAAVAESYCTLIGRRQRGLVGTQLLPLKVTYCTSIGRKQCGCALTAL
ncbi:hypothetical protein ElyMa_004490600 [Elysia marginata]|uniref:Uncharacterized protein n=1 Tax=Elysia marginata TaxID=1093978 RepID=A0AAV4HKT5_9GAST|nr:hypothetical protein ElyMa_004490600 [Elysia marginata]